MIKKLFVMKRCCVGQHVCTLVQIFKKQSDLLLLLNMTDGKCLNQPQNGKIMA